MFDAIRFIFNWPELTAVGFDCVIYSALAIVGTVLFLIRLALMTFLDADADFDVDVADGPDGLGILSFLSVTAFMMTTGWVGLAARLDLGWSMVPAGALAFASGGSMMVLTGFAMIAVRRLAEEKTFDLATAVGRTGQVYMKIPETGSGTGKVRVSVSGRSMIVDARTEGAQLEAFADVRVVSVRDDGVLLVERAS
ncbi:MAG: hypothetical protein AAGB29_02930 [Planctomycetota bacterium]